MMSMSGVSYIAPSDGYYVNNFVDGDPLYVGKVTSNGVWMLMRFSTSTGVMVYANRSNNPTYPDYDAAWTARLTLTYAEYQLLTNT